MRPGRGKFTSPDVISLPRNFLHAAELELAHPRTAEKIALKCPLPLELQGFLTNLQKDPADGK
jgi:hypothetical protein